MVLFLKGRQVGVEDGELRKKLDPLELGAHRLEQSTAHNLWPPLTLAALPFLGVLSLGNTLTGSWAVLLRHTGPGSVGQVHRHSPLG